MSDSSGCWPWQARRWLDGYALFGGSLGGVRFRARAHRVAYALALAPVVEGLLVCHACDVPACVAPHHLWVGSVAENAWDRSRKGRGTSGAKLTPDDRAVAALIVAQLRRRGRSRTRAQAEVAALFDCTPRLIGAAVDAQAARAA